MPRRAWILIVVVIALAGSGVGFAAQRTGHTTKPLIVTAAVARRDIQDQVTLTGTVSRELQRTISSDGAAQISDVSVKDGDTVNAGQSLLGIDGRQMVAEPGSLPFYRNLGVGDEGADVRQLDQILASAGYNPGPTSSVFTNQTQTALAAWQTAHGYPGVDPDKPATLTVSLQPSSAYKLGSENTAGLVIQGSPGATTQSASTATPAVLTAATLPTLTLYAANPVTAKGTPAVFIVYASKISTSALTFSVSEGGNAPSDEVLPPLGPFTIPPGATSVEIQVPTRLNGLVEPDAQLTLQLQPHAGYVVGTPSQGLTTIQSSDEPQISLTGGGTVSPGAAAVFTITADQAPVQDTSVVFQVAGTAQPGVDFQPLASTVVLRAGQRTVRVTLQTINRNVNLQPTDMVTGAWPIRIGQVFVKGGDTVAPGGELFTLTDTNFTVTLSASPSDRTQLKVGQPVTVQLEGGSAQTDGVISELDDNVTVDPTTKAETYQGKISIGNLGAADGATVTINASVQTADHVLTVPIAAVKQDGLGHDVVRVIDLEHGGRVTEVPVTTGLADSSYIEIDSGLSEGQVVIVETDTISG